jgi:hypothetical protein
MRRAFMWTWLRRCCRSAKSGLLFVKATSLPWLHQVWLLFLYRTSNSTITQQTSHAPGSMGKLDTVVQYGLPSDATIAHDHPHSSEPERGDNERPAPKHWTSSFLRASVGGLALFSDGYNAQVVGYMNPVLTELYPDDYTSSMKTRMSNAFLIGEVFGMLFFGWAIDRLGRRNGIVWATVFLVLGIILTTAASGETNRGKFWMMIVGRGVAGFGAGGWLLDFCFTLRSHSVG